MFKMQQCCHELLSTRPTRSVCLAKIRSGGGALPVFAAVALVAGVAWASTGAESYTGPTSQALHNAKGAKTLYSQNSDAQSYAQGSQNFTSGFQNSYNDAAADDFVVPKAKKWVITEIDVTGYYWNGPGPASSENVTFYKNSESIPGSTVKHGALPDLKCADNSGSFRCSLGKGLKLKSGHYWVSVVANCSELTCGQWGWQTTGHRHNDPAVWENPNFGFQYCMTWEILNDCGALGVPDLMFDLQGKETK